VTALECEVCGLAACDLPDGVDPELIFEVDDGVMHCQVCQPTSKVWDEEWPR